MPLSIEPTKMRERLYPKLSPGERRAAIEGFEKAQAALKEFEEAQRAAREPVSAKKESPQPEARR